jgi:signal transduction histidine kinase/ActR/RegA family two-component response regulator
MQFGAFWRASWVVFLLAVAASAWGAQPLAQGATLALPHIQGEPVYLRGQWGFAWQRFVDPHWQELPTRATAPVPSSWNDVRADGKPRGEDGWGSYFLRVDCPRGESLAVEALPQRTASRLFVNGELVASHGEPGRTAAGTWAAVPTRVPITREFACPLRLTLHIANFDHRAGGFVRPMSAGPADLLARERESRIIHHTGLVATYLFASVVALIFYLVRRRERTTLLYGLSCVAMAVYTDMIGERLMLRPLGGELSWLVYMRIEYLSWIAAMALFFLTLRGLFPQEIHRRAAQGVVAALGLAAVAVLGLPPAIYSYVAVPGQLVAIVVGVYVAFGMVRARTRSPVDARILLAGMLAILVAFVVDLLLIDVPGPDRKFTPFGFAFFLLSPALVLGRRLSRALNAEERSQALEENARLRDEVERISRHDLKTPLHSILGAARLLGEDETLRTAQQELAGVLQRSALRMLEMVNLSLGLFRMETGTYEFRPQSVDLGEVASHVLLDLHPYADAHGVKLLLERPAGERACVLGEELLCYSIVANLVKNAIEAAGAGQQVRLTLAGGDPSSLAIHNPGVIPADVAGHFFEKYVTRKKGGAGLGTYSARLMARTQAGDLQMRTSAQHGTTITLTLPRAAGEPVRAQPGPANRPLHALPREEAPVGDLLLVDDDENGRLVTRRLLPASLAIETAANGEAAAQSMLRRWPRWLVIDMEMPVQDGISTVRWVREQERTQGRPRCRIVMVSGNEDPASAQRALDAGADTFLAKPVSAEALLSALRPEEPAGDEPAVPALARLAEDGAVIVDPAWKDHYPAFLGAQRETVQAMESALAAGDRERLRFLAHRASGSLAMMGLDRAARENRRLQAEALHASRETLHARLAWLRDHLGALRIA